MYLVPRHEVRQSHYCRQLWHGTRYSEMSGGGHFGSYWVSRKKPTRYFPRINRPGSSNLSPFLTQSSLPETDKSKDPLLISKPLTEKKPGSPHESDRIVHTRSGYKCSAKFLNIKSKTCFCFLIVYFKLVKVKLLMRKRLLLIAVRIAVRRRRSQLK